MNMGNSMPAQLLRLNNEIASLAERHEQLRRTSQAMWHLLKSRLDVTDHDLRLAITQTEQGVLINGSDAQQSRPQLLDCLICRHPVQSTAKCCLYCGTSPQTNLQRAGLLHARHIQQ
jgi:hypothetical protein